ncbi:MAG TPA: hypothetical protein VJW73_16925, partial [Gemmatimonadaceae bacterium]|nr:hypothetical protein [Gemmatimonadaceae bacterium]
SHARAIDALEGPLDLPRRIQLALEPGEQPVPEPVATPAPEPGIGGLPPVALGQIAPRHPGVQPLEHAVEDQPIPVKGTAPRLTCRPQGFEEWALLVREFVTAHHTPARRLTTRRAPHITHHSLSNTPSTDQSERELLAPQRHAGSLAVELAPRG